MSDIHDWTWCEDHPVQAATLIEKLEREREALQLQLEDKQFCKDGLWYCAIGEKMASKLNIAAEALTTIVSHEGETLLGDGTYQDGARDAFSQLVMFAVDALKEIKS